MLRTIAGLWTNGEGELTRPADECIFLPQNPYLPLGSLRDQLTYPDVSTGLGVKGRSEYTMDDKTGEDLASGGRDDELRAHLKLLGLGELETRFDKGFDEIDDWNRMFSRGEQQRLSAIRCLIRTPKLIVLDEATSALSQLDEDIIYEELAKRDMLLISV